MTIADSTTLHWVERLISFAVFWQSAEMLQLKENFSEKGVWRWSTLRHAYKGTAALWTPFFQESSFTALVYARLVLSFYCLLFPGTAAIAVLTVLFVLGLIRTRGVFNGGSDYMSFLILFALSVSAVLPGSKTTLLALWYIALQSCLSFFVAGLHKVRFSSWRNGRALKNIMTHASLLSEKRKRLFLKHQNLILFLSWAVLVFELSFPVVFISPTYIGVAYIFAAFAFNVANFFIFGLNRFVLAWLASYPALYFCIQS